MNKTSRWATIIGIVCGAELVAAVVIGGAGLAVLFSIEAALIVALLGGVALMTVLGYRRWNARPSHPTPSSNLDDHSEPERSSPPAAFDKSRQTDGDAIDPRNINRRDRSEPAAYRRTTKSA